MRQNTGMALLQNGLLAFNNNLKIQSIKNAPAWCLQLMFNPCQMTQCMRCHGSACLLSLCVHYDFYDYLPTMALLYTR
jgi:hypothetical protein